MSCILALIGGLLIADTVYALTQVRCNIGVVLPAVLGAPLFIAGIFYSQIINAATGNNFVFILCILALFIYAVFILSLLVYVVSLCRYLKSCRATNPGKIIILGCSAPRKGISRTLMRRVNRAMELWESYPDAIVIASGGFTGASGISEAQLIAKLISEQNPKIKTVLEEKSTSTYENFVYCLELLNQIDTDGQTVFVTSHSHALRANLLAKRVGIDCICSAAFDAPSLAVNNYLREYAALINLLLLNRVD